MFFPEYFLHTIFEDLSFGFYTCMGGAMQYLVHFI